MEISTRPPGYQGPTRSHEDQREYREWTDQHGRPWYGNVEKKTGDPCGLPPQPKGWAPPHPEWGVPAEFLVAGNNYRVDGVPLGLERCVVNYAAWKASNLDSHRSWNERFFQVGRGKYGDVFDPENPPPEVLAITGPKPLPREVIVAMEQGNRYALGLTETVDERLRPFFPVRYVPEEFDFRDTPNFAEPTPTVKHAKVRPEPVGA